MFGLVFLFGMENIGTTALWNLSDGVKWRQVGAGASSVLMAVAMITGMRTTFPKVRL